jgi:flagellar assembly protein FliH
MNSLSDRAPNGSCHVVKSESLKAKVQPYTLATALVAKEPHPTTELKQRLVALEEREARLPHLEREAFERGFAEGERGGRLLEEHKNQAVLNNLAKLLDDFTTERAKLYERMEQELLVLAVEIAAQLVGRELETDPQLASHSVRLALKSVDDQANLTLKLHPIEALQLKTSLPADTGVRIVSDPALSRGGCVLQSDLGDVDASLETRFAAVLEALCKAGTGAAS